MGWFVDIQVEDWTCAKRDIVRAHQSTAHCIVLRCYLLRRRMSWSASRQKTPACRGTTNALSGWWVLLDSIISDQLRMQAQHWLVACVQRAVDACRIPGWLSVRIKQHPQAAAALCVFLRML